MDDHLVSVLSNIGILSFLALSAYLLLLTGEISFGQQAFFAIGAYAAGIATAMWGWPLSTGLLWGAIVGGAGAVLVGLPTLRLHGLYFAVATLAFAEMVRILFELFRYQVVVDGDLVGPDGADGFRGIRYVFENDIEPLQFLGLIYALLAATLIGFAWMERSRLGVIFRMIGEDPVLAEISGVATARYKLLAAGLSGALAGIGGGLYAHFTTYVEPRIFDVMLGVHSLAYGLIGGLGTAFGPLLGVVIDIGLLESTRFFSGYRMIVFGGLVAVLLIFRPRGLLDEVVMHRIEKFLRQLRRVAVSRRRVAKAGLPLLVALPLVWMPTDALAQTRAKADIACRPAGQSLEFECTIKLTNARKNNPLDGVDVSVGADMPSMPMMHSIKPTKATASGEPGTYRAVIELEMDGDWAIQLDLSGPVRDRIIKLLRFADGQPATAVPARTPRQKR